MNLFDLCSSIRSPRRSLVMRGIAAAILSVGMAGCRNLLENSQLPPGIIDPKDFENADGTERIVRGAHDQFQRAWVNGMVVTGLLTDELAHTIARGGIPQGYVAVDERNLAYGDDGYFQAVTGLYSGLHKARAMMAQAIGMLNKYKPEERKRRGEMYALLGYTEIMLADVFCSGVPLSTLDFEKDYTYRPGSTTAEIYRHAIAQFDTAFMLVADSARLLNLTRVGKGRALLSLGKYDSAMQAVANVPNDFQYQFPVYWLRTNTEVAPVSTTASPAALIATVSDLEGGTGLPWVSGGDPRTQVVRSSATTDAEIRMFPVKYPVGKTAQFTLASALEARLIRAEADLNANRISEWLGTLDSLRAHNVPALTALDDPGTEDARVDLHFAERGAWLFLTGHRQDDFRRLIRQYTRSAEALYPGGPYSNPNGRNPWYGTDITLPIPLTETMNPLSRGCFNRGA